MLIPPFLGLYTITSFQNYELFIIAVMKLLMIS